MKTGMNTQKWNLRTGVFLFLAGLVIAGGAALLLRAPGYMDAEYYYMTGQRLAEGKGFTEMILWNYLDYPQGLPHPSHHYWLPFTSLVAALGMWVFHSQQFLFAQIPFILTAAIVPVITFIIAGYSYNKPRETLLSGILGLLPGFYLAFQTTTSTLGLFMLGGGIFFWILVSIEKSVQDGSRIVWRWLLLGVTAGLLYLTRSDGVLWAAGGLGYALFSGIRRSESQKGRRFKLQGALIAFLLVLAGFLLAAGFWFVRNLSVYGTFMPPGGSATLWLTDYNQMFHYPADSLNFTTWCNSGIRSILGIRLQAVWSNLMTLLAVEGEILLLPLAIIGIWQFRRQTSVKTMLLVWLGTFLLMSFIFPFAGKRGGFLHSSAAFQPFLWSMVPAGFNRLIQWGIDHRGWKATAWRNFAILLCVLLAGYTGAVFSMKVIGPDASVPIWQDGLRTYIEVEQAVQEAFPDLQTPIVVNNPPGYTLASGGRPAVVLPDGDVESLLAVADQYGAEIAVVDRNTVPALVYLYESPATNGRLEYLFTVADTRVYLIRRER